MPPLISKQKAFGVRAEIRGRLMTGALFDIEKSHEFRHTPNLPHTHAFDLSARSNNNANGYQSSKPTRSGQPANTTAEIP